MKCQFITEVTLMKIDNRISPQILAGAVGLLQPFIPEISPQDLVEAIRDHNNESEKTSPIKQTMTIPQAAEALQVSTASIYRMLNAGQLPRIRFARRCVRIPVDAINKILEENCFNGEKQND